jgi:two-component system chemotaxis response regulator CheB
MNASAVRSPVRVLVVDDSALVREVMQRVLRANDCFVVTTAADPVIAARKIALSRPDVILLDLAMPRVDGLTFLGQLMQEDPIPVVVCSVLTDGAADMAVRALNEGAVDVVSKPRVGMRGIEDDAVAHLVDALRAASQAVVKKRAGAAAVARRLDAARAPEAPVYAPLASARSTETIVAMGASTGGTEALNVVLSALPVDAPGVVIVQHMPEGFTAAFARRLDAVCRIRVREAADGDHIERGLALIAPGNRHLIVRRESGCLRARVIDGPPVSRHRPSVDVLFGSVAEAAGASAVGVLMTGMGRDGADGLLAMKEAGATTIAQDASTCVVFGMPKEAMALGAVDEVLPLPHIAESVLERAWMRGRVEGQSHG